MNKKIFSENLSALKMCEKIYSLIFWAYALCVPYACAMFIYAFFKILASQDMLYLVRDLLFALAIFAAGFLSIYKKELKFTRIPPVIAFIPALIGDFNNIFALFFGIALVSSSVLTFVHKKYHWLESQEGFPYFNELLEENKNISEEFNENNPYQQAMERYKKLSSEKMDEI